MENQDYSHMDILNLFYIHRECHKVIARTCRVFNERHPHLTPMNKWKFRRIESNFLQYGRVKATRNRTKTVTEEEDNEINVLAYFTFNPHGSIRSAIEDLGLSYYAVERILKKHKMHDYSFIMVQALHLGDNIRRIHFCEQMLIRSQEDPTFLRKIVWSDEAKFNREGVINRRNSHYWAVENPHFLRETSFQYTFSFNVICLVMNNRVCFHIYEQNLNSEEYLEILRTVVSDLLDELPLNLLQDCWYQMDGAPAHSSNDVDRELTSMFRDQCIGRNGP